MTTHLLRPLVMALATLAACTATQAAGLFADTAVDPEFRAKVMKEKARQNALAASSFSFTNGAKPADPQCGSMNIGNVQTGGRIGAAPREVFVFAPNAINLVSGLGCR